jgi:hypothetical protein
MFYVAANGNDEWSGRLSQPNRAKTDGPLATLQGAQAVIRQLKRRQGGSLQQPVVILVRGGSYFLGEPLVFTPEDSGTAECPITIAAYENEKPIISGGRRITNWRKVKNDLWSAELPDVKSKKWYFRLLRINNEWAIRARHPNFDPNQPYTGGWLFEASEAKPESPKEKVYDRILLAPAQFPKWQDWEGAEIHIFPAWGWVNAILKVSGVDRDKNAILINCQQDIRPGNRFFIANVRQALDSPGEWYLDPNRGELYYWATQAEFPKVEVVAPAMNRLIVLKGDSQLDQGQFVEHIHFRGLTFTDTDYTLNGYYSPADSAIWFVAARKCSVEECAFINLGGYAIRLEQRSHENEIVKNSMSNLGQGGVVLLGNTKTQPFANLIAANDIQNCGQIYKHVAGVYLISGSSNRIVHNRIHRLPRYGISLKSLDKDNYSHDNIIEFNEIVNTNLETNDTGAIETLGRDQLPSGNVIRYNFICNVVGMGTTADGKILSPHFTWGIYLDDYSSGATVYGNIVIGTVIGAICIHGGKDNIVENNIFIDGLERQITLQPRDDFMTNNIFRCNIVVYKNPNAVLWYSWAKTWQKNRLSECDYNLYWHTGGLDLSTTPKSITPEGSFAAWQKLGFDLNSLISDPMFIAPERGDFRLESDSPAFKLGFEPIPIERIGPIGFSSP